VTTKGQDRDPIMFEALYFDNGAVLDRDGDNFHKRHRRQSLNQYN